jgi:hypothetical protein
MLATNSDEAGTVPMKIQYLLLISLGLFAQASALDLKGVSPGQPWEPQVIQDKLNANATAIVDSDIMRVHCREAGCSGWAIYGTCAGSTNVEAKDGKTVDAISVELSINCYDRVTSLMLQKFGPASKTLRQVKQNGFGARVNDIVLIWNKGNQSLTYEKYEKIDQTFIFLTGPEEPEKSGTL